MNKKIETLHRLQVYEVLQQRLSRKTLGISYNSMQGHSRPPATTVTSILNGPQESALVEGYFTLPYLCAVTL